MRHRYGFRIPLFILSIVGLAILAGCDTVSPDESLVLSKQATFRFEFSASNPGEAVTANSTASVDLNDLLFDEGYTRGDVILASIRSVQVERISPPETNLDVFDRIELRLTASGQNVPVVARSDNPPGDRSAQLQVVTPGVTQVVTAPSFGASITVIPTTEEDFVLTATFDLRIEVEGI